MQGLDPGSGFGAVPLHCGYGHGHHVYSSGYGPVHPSYGLVISGYVPLMFRIHSWIWAR